MTVVLMQQKVMEEKMAEDGRYAIALAILDLAQAIDRVGGQITAIRGLLERNHESDS